MARLFISQERLDEWSAEERVEIRGNTMTLIAEGRDFEIWPAVRFTRVADRGEDPNGLLETVLDERALSDMGADHYMDSVIVGDTAYDVQAGFLGTPLPPGSRER